MNGYGNIILPDLTCSIEFNPSPSSGLGNCVETAQDVTPLPSAGKDKIAKRFPFAQEGKKSGQNSPKGDILSPTSPSSQKDLKTPVKNFLTKTKTPQKENYAKNHWNTVLSKWKTKSRPSFKNVVRAIIRANRWKIPLNIKEENSNSEVDKSWYEDQQTLHFNVNAFKAATSSHTGLSKRAQFIFMKNSWERTDEELDLLYSVVKNMKCFSKYSTHVKRDLASVMYFETFEDGRVIIQEGYHGISMYFIVSGSVLVQVRQVDTRTGETKNYTVGEITAGSSFGELALIQHCKRTATIVCKGTSEFLRVDKPDFDMVLRRSYEQEWQDRLKTVKSFPFFANWTEADIRHVALNCSLSDFKQDEVILGNKSDSENIYFILYGVCRIVREINILETTYNYGRRRTMLSVPPPTGSELLKSCQSVERQISTRFVNMGQLSFGNYFGCGESMKNTYIVSVSKVGCMLVPHHTLAALERVCNLSGNDAPNNFTIKEMQQVAEARLLNEKKVFEKWMANLRWRNYKKQIMKEIFYRKNELKRVNALKPFNLKNFDLQDHHARIVHSTTTTLQPQGKVEQTFACYRKGGYQKAQKVQLPPLLGNKKPTKVPSIKVEKNPSKKNLSKNTSSSEAQTSSNMAASATIPSVVEKPFKPVRRAKLHSIEEKSNQLNVSFSGAQSKIKARLTNKSS